MRKLLKQKLKCLKCGKVSMQEGPESCPYCGHSYLKWVNYDPQKDYAKDSQVPDSPRTLSP